MSRARTPMRLAQKCLRRPSRAGSAPTSSTSSTSRGLHHRARVSQRSPMTAASWSNRAVWREERLLHIFPARSSFSTTSAQRHGHLDAPKPGEEIHVTIVDQEGGKHAFEVSEGDNLLDIAQANDLEMEGACGGSCACSTCHVIVEENDAGDMFDRLPEAEDDENDMLDLAFGLTETSRLGCQIKMTRDLDGLVVRLPSATRNLQKSDFEKK